MCLTPDFGAQHCWKMVSRGLDAQTLGMQHWWPRILAPAYLICSSDSNKWVSDVSEVFLTKLPSQAAVFGVHGAVKAAAEADFSWEPPRDWLSSPVSIFCKREN